MSTPTNFTLTTKDGLNLQALAWKIEHPRAIICIVHGFGEYIERYQHVATFFNEAGFDVFGYTQRGHGHSQGKQGHMPSYEHILDDMENMLSHIQQDYTIALPLFVYGHSFGGGVVSNYILRRNVEKIKAVVLSSPWLRLVEPPSPFLVPFIHLAAKLYPTFSQYHLLEGYKISKDPEVIEAYEKDPLIHGNITTRFFSDTHKAGEWAIQHASSLSIPALIMHGTDDKITSQPASEEFAEKAGNLVNYKKWQGVRHEGHNDFEKEELLNFVLQFLENQLK